MANNDFLFELGCEELPPRSLQKLINALQSEVAQSLQKEKLNYDDITAFATPRRLALFIKNLDAQQPDQDIKRKGPALSAAFDSDGQATKAALGFARSCQTTVEKLQQVENSDGSYLFYIGTQAGKKTITIMPEIIKQALARLPIAKRMRWGARTAEFIRPVHWIVMMLGKEVIKANLFDHQASNITYGHRFHAPNAIKIKNPADYEALLQKKGYVIANFEKRQQAILNQIQKITQTHGVKAITSEELLSEVTSLVEWPVAYWCQFENEFLDVPRDGIIAEIEDNQKSFAITDQHDQLQANFITVSNIESKNPEEVKVGNQRVMRARLSDAAFFYHTDCKQSLESRVDTLKEIVYQAKLGTLHDKMNRLQKISAYLAKQLKTDLQLTERAAYLSKADLVTDMVGEFPELQGLMGYHYAKHDGEKDDVAIALKEQYLPRFAQDELPNTLIGCVLAIAERIDSLVAIFAIGQAPTGEKDPFGLRRAAIGLIRILIEKKVDLDIAELISETAKILQPTVNTEQAISQVKDFLFERLRHWYQQQGINNDLIQAVLANQPTRLLDFEQRLQAVIHFGGLDEASSLAMANKRVKNILHKQDKQVNLTKIDQQLLQQPEEQRLAQLLNEKEQQIKPLIEKRDYIETLSVLASLKQPVDDFFDHVMVNVDDEALRQNRLQLLAHLQHLFLQVADISVLQ